MGNARRDFKKRRFERLARQPNQVGFDLAEAEYRFINLITTLI